jgi:molybdate transport system substrate-binding protein
MLVPRRLFAIACALVLLAACASPGAPALPAPKPTTAAAVPTGSDEIVVFAAASLTDAFNEIGAAFKQTNPHATITFNFGASSQLRTQLEQGARADVFASADQAQMDNARKADARNRLVLIVPKDNPARIAAVEDLGNDGIKFVTAQQGVPIGQYTTALLDKAVADPAYGADFKTKVEGNIVSREDNVRQVVSKVQLGEADVGVVYTTDVTPQVRDQVQQIAVPDPLQTIASYPIAVAKGSNAAGGEAFVQFVLGQTGQAILARWGFLTANASSARQVVRAPDAG